MFQIEGVKKAIVQIAYSKDAQDKHFLETGKQLHDYNVVFESDRISQKLRSAFITLDWFGFSSKQLTHSEIGISAFYNNKPVIRGTEKIVFDEAPTDKALEEIIRGLADEMLVLKAELTERLIAWESEEEKRKEMEAAMNKAHEVTKEKFEAEKIAEAQTVKPVDDLYQKLMTISGLEVDDRFSSWIKFVDVVNPDSPGAYMFEGPFLQAGTVEVVPERQLFIVSTTTGSRRYQTTQYVLMEKTADGKLVKHHTEDDNKRGWSLRMRPYVDKLLGIEQPEMIMLPVDLLQEAINAIGSDYYTELIDQLEHYLK
jgi:hypothetical protein